MMEEEERRNISNGARMEDFQWKTGVTK